MHNEEERKEPSAPQRQSPGGSRKPEEAKEPAGFFSTPITGNDREKCALIVNAVEERMLGMNYAGGMEETSDSLNKNYTRYIQALDRMGKSMKFESVLLGMAHPYEGANPFESETRAKAEKRYQVYELLGKKIDAISKVVEGRAARAEGRLVVHLST